MFWPLPTADAQQQADVVVTEGGIRMSAVTLNKGQTLEVRLPANRAGV